MVKAAVLVQQPQLQAEIVVITTAGDKHYDKTFGSFGLKGMFTKEIEDALLGEQIDIAVHSMKDMPSVLPDGLVIAGMLPREDVRDAFVSSQSQTFDALPQGAVLGTSSVRRTAQIRRLRPDVQIVPFRGNVTTRLAKLDAGDVAATLLAVAGLKRLDMANRITQAISTELLLPAIAQGAVGIECRADDEASCALIASISHQETTTAVACERALLAGLDGSCKTPIAGLATLSGNELHLQSMVIAVDGSACIEHAVSGSSKEAEALGKEAAEALLAKGADKLLRE